MTSKVTTQGIRSTMEVEWAVKAFKDGFLQTEIVKSRGMYGAIKCMINKGYLGSDIVEIKSNDPFLVKVR